jgi:hypothetical protein
MKADPDVWIRASVKPNGEKYYEMVLIYVDDILHCSHQPKLLMKTLGELYHLKEGSVKEPERYLGATIKKFEKLTTSDDGTQTIVNCWSMSSEEYVKNAISIVEDMMKEDGIALPGKKASSRPMPIKYRPELDVSPELSFDLANRYQQLIGILRWACELGRLDILLEVALLASHSCMPREGHLDAVYRIFGYLKYHERSTLVFDHTRPRYDCSRFRQVDWKDFYGDVQEAIPPNMPEPLGQPVTTTCFVDADHAGNLLTRRSHTGILIFVNMAPIIWYSKRQNTVESSTFGSEFVALRVATELIEGLRYKLRMFGIPIDGPTDVLCDNQSVVTNALVPESTLSKKHNAICYHKVCEAVASGTILVGKEASEMNLSDLFSKPLDTLRRHTLVEHMLY